MNKDLQKIIKKNKHRSSFYKQVKTSKPKSKHIGDKEVESKFVKFLYAFKNRVLISAMVLLVLLISKKSTKLEFIYEETFKPLNFAQIDKLITKNIGTVFPKLKENNLTVNNSYITLNNSSKFENGLKVTTRPYEMIQSHTKGIVIKKNADTIVIQDEFGREFTYGNLEDIKVNLYSRVSYGEKLGIGKVSENMNDGIYYLSIKSNDEYLDVMSVVNDEV